MTLDLTATQLTDPGDGLPLLVVGPSIGASVTALWSSCANRLAGRFHVVGWDLPGHGRSATIHETFTMADLAAAVVSLIDKIDPSTGSARATRDFFYAGDSAGGAVGLQLLLDALDRIVAAVIISSGAKIGEAALVARGHHEELAMHARAALRNGLKPDEIKELLLQTAIYCGVPDANTAFRIARQALNEGRAEQDQRQKEDS
jgi:pimeloyl-ACP methyl ester carboxylesterase